MWLILLAATLTPLFILSFYNHPCNEDYWEADMVLDKGFWGAQHWWYITWEGRYFASFLRCLSPLALGFYWGYKLNAIILLLLFSTAVYWLLGKLFTGIDKITRLGLTSLFIFIFILLMPDIAEGIFWQSSSYAIFTAQIMTLFLLGSIIGYYQSKHKKGYMILSCFLVIAIIGSYEIAMVFIDFIVMLLVTINVLRKKNLFFPLMLMGVCLVFSFIEIQAPGNSLRGTQLHYTNNHNLLFSLKRSFVWGAYLLSHWLPFLILVAILLFDLLITTNLRNKETEAIFSIPPGFSVMACLTIPVIGSFVHFWATGFRPAQRTIDLFYFYFIAGIMYSLFSVISRIKKQNPNFKIPSYVKFPV
ncbi:MAG TPA: hypothetical protein VN922_10430, partial [Bacteroidia bacterium]|nr:hypothetical protein [Bacteroidia bacterium]